MVTMRAQEILETDFGVVGNAKNGFCPSSLYILSVFSSTRSPQKILDIDCCVPQGSCLGQILFIMYVSSIFNGVKNHLPSIHAYAYDIRCICPPSLCRHLRNMMRSENLAKLVQLTFERGWPPTDSR